MRWYHWILFAGIAVATVLAFLLGRRHGDLSSSLSTELEALDARAQAKKWKAELDAAKAAFLVETRYKEKIARLDKEALDEVDRLRSDPVALADLLARLSN